jgi:hypothetical protein
MEQEIVSRDGNSQLSFVALPLKTNGYKKTQVRTTKSYSIQQSLGTKRLVDFVGGSFLQ